MWDPSRFFTAGHWLDPRRVRRELRTRMVLILLIAPVSLVAGIAKGDWNLIALGVLLPALGIPFTRFSYRMKTRAGEQLARGRSASSDPTYQGRRSLGATGLIGGTVAAWLSLGLLGGVTNAVQHSDPAPAVAGVVMAAGFGLLSWVLTRSGTSRIHDADQLSTRRTAKWLVGLNAVIGALLLVVALFAIVAVALGRPLHGELNTPARAYSAFTWLAICGSAMVAGATWLGLVLRRTRAKQVESIGAPTEAE